MNIKIFVKTYYIIKKLLKIVYFIGIFKKFYSSVEFISFVEYDIMRFFSKFFNNVKFVVNN